MWLVFLLEWLGSQSTFSLYAFEQSMKINNQIWSINIYYQQVRFGFAHLLLPNIIDHKTIEYAVT